MCVEEEQLIDDQSKEKINNEETQEDSNKNINKNMLLGVIGMVLIKVVSLLTVVFVGYIMTSSEYGNLSTYNTWVTIFGVFIGLQLSGSIQNAFVEYSKEKFMVYCSTILLIALASTVVAFIPFLAANNSLAELLKIEPILAYTLIPQCLGSFLVSFMSTYYLAQKKVNMNLIWTVAYALLLSAFSLSFASIFEVKEIGYAIGTFIPNIGFGIVCLVYFFVKTKFKFDFRYLKFALMFSIPLIMHMLGNVILGQSDKLMIRYMMDETKTGEYTMVHNYALLLNSLWAAFNSVFIPYFYDNLKKNDYDNLKSQSKNYLIFFSSISFGFILVGREIVKFIVKEEYYAGLDIFELAVLAQYFIFIYSFSVNYEFFKKKTIWIAIGTILTAIINIILNYFFINEWGIFGAALASAISYLILIAFHEFIARKIVREYPLKLSYFVFFVAISIIVTIGSILLHDYWFIKWIIGSLIGLFIVIRLIKIKRII